MTVVESLEERLGRRWTAVVVGISAQLISFSFYSYAFWLPPDGRWRSSVLPIVREPFAVLDLADDHVRHRILGPLIAHTLGLGKRGYMVWIAGVTALLVLTYLLVRRYTEPSVAALVTLLIATTPVAVTSQTWLGLPDALAYAALVGCMLSRRLDVMSICMVIAMFTDERTAAAIPLILLWHHIAGTDPDRPPLDIRRAGALLLPVILWFGAFLWMQDAFEIPPSRELEATLTGGFLREHGLAFLPGLFFALRMGWVVPIKALTAGTVDRRIRWALGAATFVALLPAILGTDFSRVGAIAFPTILIGVLLLSKASKDATRRLLVLLVVINLATPLYQTIATDYKLIMPLPISVGRALS